MSDTPIMSWEQADQIIKDQRAEIERLGGQTNLDAAPAARASMRECASPAGTGGTQKPFAWAADIPGKFGAAPTVLFGYTEKLVRGIAAAGGDAVTPFPLYRQPQPAISEAEWDALYQGTAVLLWEGHTREEGSEGSRNLLQIAATLKGLRERLEACRE